MFTFFNIPLEKKKKNKQKLLFLIVMPESKQRKNCFLPENKFVCFNSNAKKNVRWHATFRGKIEETTFSSGSLITAYFIFKNQILKSIYLIENTLKCRQKAGVQLNSQ